VKYCIFILILLAGYLIGSIPWGYLIGKFKKGIDIRKFGSGNIGTTNVLRVLGGAPAVLVLGGDMGKGIAAVCIGMMLASSTGMSPKIIGGLAGLSSILGHNWPVFLKFKGGKGVATSAGVFLTLTPLSFVLSLAVMLLVVFFTRYVSLGSILAAGSLPLFVLLCAGGEMRFYLILSLIAAAFTLFTHRSNLRRLLNGCERKLGEKEKI